MNRQITSFDIYVIVYELQQLILESYIDKIYQISKEEIIIRIRNPKTKEKNILYIRNSGFPCLTGKGFEVPARPSVFAMTLRKYLQNGRIIDVTQHEFDRIIMIKVKKGEEVYTLIVEFLSQGNIILIDSEGKIILPLIQRAWAHRRVKGREEYIPPPSQLNPFEITFENFKEIIGESKADIVRTLAVKLNLGGLIAEEICTRSNIDKNLRELDEEAMLKVFNELKAFLGLFSEKQFNPVVVEERGVPIDILPFPFQSYRNAEFKPIKYMVKGLEVFINQYQQTAEENVEEEEIDTLIEKIKRQLRQQEEKMESINKLIEEKKREGDLLYLHYQECNKLLEKISSSLRKKNREEVVRELKKETIVKEIDLTRNTLRVVLEDLDGEKRDIKLDFRKTLSENAERAYEECKKLQRKLKGVKEAIQDTMKRLREAEEEKKVMLKKKEGNKGRKDEKKEKTYWFEKFRWFISSNGNLVIGGRDAKTNEIIVKKYLREGDRYVHADIQGAPSCIVKQRDIEDKPLPITNETLREACVFAASYSKAWKQFMESQAYWVHPEQVSKTPQSGEYLPKGAFVIRGKRSYCRCKLELAIGRIKINDTYKLMGAPEEALKKYTNRYVVIQPGNINRNEVARELSLIFNASIDEVLKVLPPGGSQIVRRVNL